MTILKKLPTTVDPNRIRMTGMRMDEFMEGVPGLNECLKRGLVKRADKGALPSQDDSMMQD